MLLYSRPLSDKFLVSDFLHLNRLVFLIFAGFAILLKLILEDILCRNVRSSLQGNSFVIPVRPVYMIVLPVKQGSFCCERYWRCTGHNGIKLSSGFLYYFPSKFGVILEYLSWPHKNLRALSTLYSILVMNGLKGFWNHL